MVWLECSKRVDSCSLMGLGVRDANHVKVVLREAKFWSVEDADELVDHVLVVEGVSALVEPTDVRGVACLLTHLGHVV